MNLKHYIKDLVYGANDGIITTFAIIAGGIGAQVPLQSIIIISFVSLAADAFSMASSNYLGSKSELEVDKKHSHAKPSRSALLTFVAFVAAGSIPIVALLLSRDGPSLGTVSLATAAALFIVGLLRTRVTGRHPLIGAFEMLVVGGVAALIAYFVGTFVSNVL